MGKLELTLALLKPDLYMRERAREAVKSLIRKKGFLIVRQADVKLTQEVAEKFYAEHEGKFFYNRLLGFMCMGPLHGTILAHSNAIQQWRSLMGPTKPCVAQSKAPWSIRGIYGLSDTRNSAHGSDSEASAHREIGILFPDFDVDKWYDNEEEQYRNGTIEFSAKEQTHVITSSATSEQSRSLPAA